MNSTRLGPRSSRLLRQAVLWGGVLAFLPSPATAQDVLGAQRRQASRAEIEQAITSAEQVAATADSKTREKLLAQAGVLRARLKNGDFAPGDRLFMRVLNDSSLTDTITVRNEQKIQLTNIPDISLAGVLDSELSSHLTTELSKYLKDPQVSAIGLVRLTVMGGVGEPGFVTVPVDQLVTDVLMTAGGPSQTSKFDDAVVRRAQKTYLDRKQFAEAVRTGKTVGDMSLRDGDEIYIPIQTVGNNRFFQMWMPAISASLGIYWLIRGGRTRRTP